jgi:hypothetical protein
MKLQMIDGLPIVTLTMTYGKKTIELNNVLLDTGCAATIFDTNILESIDINIDYKNGKARRMYGVGGEAELCFEQKIKNLNIDGHFLDSFQLQLGSVREEYNFEGILGNDFMIKMGMVIDFNDLTIHYVK